MIFRQHLAPMVALLLLFAGIPASAGPLEEADAVLNRFEQTFNTGNWDAVVALYTKDVHFFGTVEPELVVGSEALRKYFGNLRKGLKVKFVTGSAVLQIEPNVLIISGYQVITGSSGNENVFRSTFVMHKVDGNWLIAQRHVSPMSKK